MEVYGTRKSATSQALLRARAVDSVKRYASEDTSIEIIVCGTSTVRDPPPTFIIEQGMNDTGVESMNCSP